MRFANLVVLAGLCLVRSALAQERPRLNGLRADADTNDAMTYYQYGVDILYRKPDQAARAFELAHRISPDWPDPLYGRWVAQLLARRSSLPGYLEGNRRVVRSKEIRAIDSLYYRALTLNPFVYRRFDNLLFDAYFDALARRIEQQEGRPLDRSQLRYYFDRAVLENPGLQAWMAYSAGRFDEAMRLYSSAIKKARYKAGLFAARARAAFLKADYETALTDMTAALEEERQSDEEDLVYFYDSKAIFEHSVAIVHELTGKPAEAQEAYARALQEDLSYRQAHARLAALAIAGGDTATAISEYDLGVQLAADDPVLRFRLGELLAATGRHAEAVEHLKAAIAAEPLFAPSYYALGRAYDALGQPAEALGQYEAFVARAARKDANLVWVQERIAAARGGKQP